MTKRGRGFAEVCSNCRNKMNRLYLRGKKSFFGIGWLCTYCGALLIDDFEKKKAILSTTERSKIHWLERKLKYVQILGGKCSKCGYNQNLAALEFHHPNGKEKDAENPRSPNFKVEDCVLLCANCHREEHNVDYAKDRC